MSGSVCKFFLEGYCKFGSRCKFRHVYNNYSNEYRYDNYEYQDDQYHYRSRQPKGYSGVSILRSGSSSSPVNYSNNSNNNNNNHHQTYNNNNINNSSLNAYDLWKAILKEVTTAESGKQWPLTCFFLSREYGNIPGWIDHSPEELRWETYKAIKEGSFEQCKLSIGMLYKNAEDRRNDFKTKEKGVSVAESLISLKNSRDTSTVSGAPLLFGSGSSVGRDGSIWGNREHGHGQQQPQLQQSLFGVNSTVHQAPIAQANSFMNNQPFQDPSTTFTFTLNQQQPIPLQQQQLSQPTSPFNTGSLMSRESPFQTALPLASSPFQGVNVPSHGSSVPLPQINPSPFASVSTLNHPDQPNNYSNLADLSESEVTAFQAKMFKFGGIPLKPPPKQMC